MLSNIYNNTTTITILIEIIWSIETIYGKLTYLKLSSIFVSKTGCDLSFWSTIMEIYSFEVSYFVNKNENM